jgi:uncharacterized protein
MTRTFGFGRGARRRYSLVFAVLGALSSGLALKGDDLAAAGLSNAQPEHAKAQTGLEGRWIGGHLSDQGYTWIRLTIRPDSANPGRHIAVVDLPFQFNNGMRSPLTVNGDRIGFQFRQRAGETRAIARVRGDTLFGEAEVGNKTRALRFTRVVPLLGDVATKITGLYQTDQGRRVSISGPSELGLFTFTDWETGEQRQLFSTRNGLVGGPSLYIPHPPAVRVQFRSDSSGQSDITVRTEKVTYTAKPLRAFAEEAIEWQSDGVTISGSLVKPLDGRAQYPVVVFVHGSGPTTRNSSFEFQSYLALHGVASLVYDKRGVGKSGGMYVHVVDGARLELLARDAIAGIELISRRPDIDTTSVGVWGISQAGWIIPVIAAKSPHVDYTVIVSGPTTTVDQEGYFGTLTGDDGDGTRLPETEISERMKNYVPRGFDPVPYLRAQTADGLWIYGGKDESVPVDMSIENLRLLQKEGKPFQVMTFPKGQHVMWEAEDGSRQHMPLLKRFVPGYYEAMTDWILQHTLPRISRPKPVT